MKERFFAITAAASAGCAASQARMVCMVAPPFGSAPLSTSTRPIGV